MNKYEEIFTMLVDTIREDMKREIYVLPDGFEVDMAEIEKVGDMYE